MDQAKLTQRAVGGIFWSYLSFISGKGLAFITTIILARLLSPTEFGLMGYCLIALQYLDILNVAGFDSALISQKDNIEDAANTAFLSNLMLGITWLAIAWLGAPLVADFFENAGVTPTLRVLALTLPIAGLGLVPDAMIQRSLRFRTRLFSDLARNLSKGLVSIGMALAGFGVWSLVGGQIAGVTAGTAFSWKLAKWKPSWRFNPRVSRTVWLFGFNIVLLNLMGAFASNVDYMLVGRILGTTALGYYTMAYRIPDLIIRSMNLVVGRVSFPVLAQTQSDSQKLRAYYFSYIRYLALFVYPVGFGLALTAPISIPFFLSSKWEPAVIPTALVSVALAIIAVGYVPGVFYKAIGRPDILNKLAVIKIPCAVAILWVSTRWGINGVAAGQILIAITNVILDTLTVNKIMRYSVRELFQALFPGLISALVMAAALWGVWQGFHLDGFFGLVMMVALGGGVYFLTLLLVSRQTVVKGLAVLQDLVRQTGIMKLWVVSHE